MQILSSYRLVPLIAIVFFSILNAISLEASYYAEDPTDSISFQMHPNVRNHIYGYTSKGFSLQLKDGSMWEVTPHKREMIMQWRKNERIFIKPAYACFLPSNFITYKYVLYNEKRNEIAEVKLIKESIPVEGGAFIINWIEPYQQIIQINDGTLWQVNLSESELDKWEVGHRVFVGVNNNWRTEKYPYILINMDMHNIPLKKAEYCPAMFYSN